ncbi:hypothetical protein CSKR_113728 [Clonorchis sinensis]|uniref:DUF7083 domain-containing protein n=1 Tax=Clonorchis sinensis TaxID=79923 RepID=A0A3R7CQH0_CLOSI|nr:hypothetical protein CSKR_113728 [Clonorchis sinensis]
MEGEDIQKWRRFMPMMPVSSQRMQAVLQEQQAHFGKSQAQFEQYQAKLIETLSQNFSRHAIAVSLVPAKVPSTETLTQHISEFQYDANSEFTLKPCFHYYEDMFRIDLVNMSEEKKIRLMLQKLGAA